MPGWYPDPAGTPNRFRYWDGRAWSTDTTDNPAAAPTGCRRSGRRGDAGGAGSPPPKQGRRRFGPLILALAALVVLVLVGVLVRAGPVRRPPHRRPRSAAVLDRVRLGRQQSDHRAGDTHPDPVGVASRPPPPTPIPTPTRSSRCSPARRASPRPGRTIPPTAGSTGVGSRSRRSTAGRTARGRLQLGVRRRSQSASSRSRRAGTRTSPSARCSPATVSTNRADPPSWSCSA